MRKALIVGVDFYFEIAGLHGCVNDADAVRRCLERHEDGSVNFAVRTLTATGPLEGLYRVQLREAVKDLFADDVETALFYFSGHGFMDKTGGYLLTSDCAFGDDGLSLSDVLVLANRSPAKNKIIILDCCHSGIAGSSLLNRGLSVELALGITILTASTAEQYATEQNGAGVFTALLVDALKGSAANLMGEVTPSSLYAHIDQALGPWEQRPMFKTNVKSFVSLRKVNSPIALADLLKLVDYFPQPGFEYALDPSFQPEAKRRDAKLPKPDPENTKIFELFQKYQQLNLLRPVNTAHLSDSAIFSKTCRLTALGEHYRALVQKKRI